MKNPDEFYDNIGSLMQSKLRTDNGPIYSSFNQHVGKIINHEETTLSMNKYDEMLHRIERILKGEKAEHWEGQNKKSDLEKKIDKIKKENLEKANGKK